LIWCPWLVPDFPTCDKNIAALFLSKMHFMKRIATFCILLVAFSGLSAQSIQLHPSAPEILTQKRQGDSDSLKGKSHPETTRLSKTKKLLLATDTLTLTDFVMSIERVNDNLNDIQDSSKLKFEVVNMSRRIDQITSDVNIIRQNNRDRNASVNVKNLYLYQSLASALEDENSHFQSVVARMYNRVYHAKNRLKTVLSDSVFHEMYADPNYRAQVALKLTRLERKWMRTDSTAKANIDSLNSLKIKTSDNSISLSNLLNMMDTRLDRARHQLFGQEVSPLWSNEVSVHPTNASAPKAITILGSEQNAIGYYFGQTSGERSFVLIAGLLLFSWLFLRRKFLMAIREQNESFGFLHLRYLNTHPVLSLFVVLLCLMPFFSAYAPTSYIAIEYFLLLIAACVILFRNWERRIWTEWLILVVLFVANTFTYLLIEPLFLSRWWMLALHLFILYSSFRFYKSIGHKMPYHKWIQKSTIFGMILIAAGIFFNLFGRFSLSGIFGIAGIFAVTQAVILPVFVDSIIEIVLVQIAGSRWKKGVVSPFDCSVVIKKMKGPLLIVAVILWLIMVASNLNLYHNVSTQLGDLLTNKRSIGSISYRLINVLWFFAIIWLAHLLQRLVGFLFGETGIGTDDLSAVSKEKHSRMLITRLLLLIGGYLLAVAASGLPIDKLTFVLGALGVGIGMGLQSIVNNFVSGIILIFDGSLQIGDQIEVNGQAGKVKEIGLRASTLNTADGAEVIIPNGNILSQNIVNWTYSNDEKRVILRFSLTGNVLDANNINLVINETIAALPEVNISRTPVILYSKVSGETCWLHVHFWTTIQNADRVKSDALVHLNSAFAAAHIDFK